MTAPLLSVSGLRTTFDTPGGIVKAADDVSFEVRRGETICLVGESSSGKTVACESITGLVARPPGKIEDGQVVFDGRYLLECSPVELREIRGNRIAYVFQNPQGALDPVYTVETQVMEAIQFHRDMGDAKAESVLSAELSEVVSGDIAGANERLSSEFATVCERENPSEKAIYANHPTACHLHDVEAENEEWASVD